MKFIKRFFILILLLSFFIFISALSYVHAISNDISSNIFRLHIIANSDSDEDQSLKYLVRDNVLEYMNEISKNCNSKTDVIYIANQHKDQIKKIAENVITENGFNYEVSVQIGNFEFPTKHYGDISLPAGYYDALRIKIGKSEGQNWWCVMFPPLCFVDITSGIVPDESKQIMQNNLGEEEYKLISDSESNDIKLKFSIVEFFKNIRFAKN